MDLIGICQFAITFNDNSTHKHRKLLNMSNNEVISPCGVKPLPFPTYSDVV